MLLQIRVLGVEHLHLQTGPVLLLIGDQTFATEALFTI